MDGPAAAGARVSGGIGTVMRLSDKRPARGMVPLVLACGAALATMTFGEVRMHLARAPSGAPDADAQGVLLVCQIAALIVLATALALIVFLAQRRKTKGETALWSLPAIGGIDPVAILCLIALIPFAIAALPLAIVLGLAAQWMAQGKLHLIGGIGAFTLIAAALLIATARPLEASRPLTCPEPDDAGGHLDRMHVVVQRETPAREQGF